MAGKTPRFGLNMFGSGTPGTLNDDGAKYTSLDRLTIDRLFAAIEQHDHRYQSPVPAVTTVPTGVLLPQSGELTGGFTYHYRVSTVDANGAESIASPELHVSTPTPLDPPGLPALSVDAEVGTLAPGYYQYALTALRGLEESTIGGAATISIMVGETSVHIETPPLGAAEGYRVWRMGSQDIGWTRIGIATAGEFVDDGSVLPDPCACDPGVAPPAFNSGISSYAIEVTLPVATDLTGVTSWRLYRSVYAGIYTSASLVHEVVEGEDEWDENSPLTRSWVDTGAPMTLGQPQSSDLNMRFQPLTFDSAEELPDVAGYPANYPIIVEGQLYAKVDTEWKLVGGGGGGEGGGMSPVITSPSGNRFVLAVADDGTISTQPTLFPGPPAPVQNVAVS